jgi:hypothetical protein
MTPRCQALTEMYKVKTRPLPASGDFTYYRSMKRITPIIVAAAILLAAAIAQTPLPGRKIATLGPEEYIVSEESCLLAGGSGCLADDFFVVTHGRVAGKTVFFTYDKSGRKGPFSRITEDMLKPCAAKMEPHKFYLESDSSNEGLEEVPDPANQRQHFIRFGGKRVGPFQQTLSAGIAPDKSRAFIAGIRDKVLHFASTDGRDVAAVGMPQQIAISRDGGKAVLVCLGNLTMYEGIDLKPESLDMTQFENISLFTLDGKKFGPFKKSDDFGEAWALAESPDWLFTVGKTAYFNGTPLKPFGEQISKSRFWIDDATHYAWLEDEQLRFSDGVAFPNPLMLKWEKKAGKTTLCWISILPNRDVVGYSRLL